MLVDIYEDGELRHANVPVTVALSAMPVASPEAIAVAHAIRSTGAATVRSTAPAFRVIRRVNEVGEAA